MDYNEHNNEAEALFATKRKQQQAEEAERKRLEELEQQKRQMAEEVKRLEALQATQRAQEARMAWEAQQAQQTQQAQQPQQAQQTQWAQQPQQAQQTYGVPGTGAAPTGEKKGLDPKKKKIILIGALAALAVVALAVVLILVLGSKEPSEASAEDLEKYVEPYYGMWEYDEYDTRIGINADDTWAAYDAENDRINGGVYYWEDGKLVLEDAAGDKVLSLSLGSDDRLYDSDGDALFRWSGGSIEDGDEVLSPFYGTWKIDEDVNNRIEIYEDGTWSVYVPDMKEMVHGGYCEWENGQLVLRYDDGEFIDSLSLGSDERLYAQYGSVLTRYDASNIPWFEDHGMNANYRYGDPAKTVASGFSLEGKETGTYARIPADWYVERSSRQSTGDGNCVITLAATLTTDGNTMPAYTTKENYWFNYSWAICDYYTGFYLPNASKDTLYSYSYEATGETVHVEFSFTEEYAKAEDKSWNCVVTLTVRMPEDYDGLVLSCYDAPKSREINDQRYKCFKGGDVFLLDEFPDWQDFASGLICKINE